MSVPGARFRGAAAILLVVLAAPVRAQLGSGWTEYNPPERVQTRGCGEYGAAGGVETFRLTCAAMAGDNRGEQRVENDYSSGTRQFEGEVRVASLGGTNVSVKQTFMPNNGAFLMIGVANDGRLYSVGDNGLLATEVIGRWIRINTIHDVSAGTHQMYVDGMLKVTKTGGRQVAWHDKYGAYRLGSGRGPAVVEWRNVRYWRDGRSGGGAPPVPGAADASIPDPQPDAATTEADGPSLVDGPHDTGGAGGAGGTRDAGISGATGGRGGAADAARGPGPGPGGDAGPGDDPDVDDPGGAPSKRPSASGCAVGGVRHRSGGWLALAGLMLLAACGRRRPRGR